MFYRWSDVEKRPMNPLTVRQAIHGEHVTIARIELRKGAMIAEHSHHNEQIANVLSGSIRFILAGEEIVVRAGEALRIAPHVPHSAEGLEDTIVIETFSPPREDWK
jgi:quercetin dioxygenase-like cupin family protein